MRGYWRRPDATAEVMHAGWYRTGDGGYLDNDGYLFLTDRIKDLIVSGGENISPSEVEEVLRRFPRVYEVSVFGIPHVRWGEAVGALVECKPGETLDTDELLAFARTQIAGFKCPKWISKVDRLPRTASGKVQRGLAKELMLSILASNGALPAST